MLIDLIYCYLRVHEGDQVAEAFDETINSDEMLEGYPIEALKTVALTIEKLAKSEVVMPQNFKEHVEDYIDDLASYISNYEGTKEICPESMDNNFEFF